MCIGMVLACAGSATIAEPFVYQGQLKESGAPANGEYDFRFELYDAETGGMQIGATNAFGNLEVVDGVFHVDLDFGFFAFDGTNRWLRIQVRPGANVGAYTDLTPRTPMSKAPQAQIADEALFADHAITAETLINPQWTDAPGILWYGDGNDRVLVNRSSTIAFDEYLGVHANTSGGVGIIVSGNSGSEPYVGFGVNGQVEAEVEYDGPSGALRVRNNNTLAFAVTDDGETNFFEPASATQGMTSTEYKFSSPKTGYISVGAVDFGTPFSNRYLTAWSDGAAIRSAEPGDPIDRGDRRAVASVDLPHGAVVTRMEAYLTDNVADIHLELKLVRSVINYNEISSAGELCSVNTSFIGGTRLQYVDNTVNNSVVDNSSYNYFLLLDSVFTSSGIIESWPSGGFNSYGVVGVVIEYTVDEAD